jgi:PAS domain S-box-containing protein
MNNNFFHKHPLISGFCILVFFSAISAYAILTLVNHEIKRDYDKWRITLGVLADNRAGDVSKWVENQFAVLNNLAQNGSVQLYTQQLLRQNKSESDAEPAQISYLRNLLYSTADKNNFLDSEQAASPIQANITFQANNGMALISKDLEIITATPGIDGLANHLRQTILEVISTGKPMLYDLRINSNNQPVVGFLAPVYPLQVQTGSQEPVAVLFAVKNAQNTLFPLLKSESKTTLTAETLLVRKDGESITYLTPLADGTPGVKKQLAANDMNLASAYAAAHPGSFNELMDYSGAKVLSTSRSIAGLPWILVQKIGIDEALNESSQHQQFLMMVLFLATLLVLALLIAAWWYGSSVREKNTKDELFLKTRELLAKTHLLDAINENISDYIFLVDSEGRLVFANSLLAKNLGMAPEDIINKNLTSLFGPEISNTLTPIFKICLAQEKSSIHSLVFELQEKTYLFHSIFSPVRYRKDHCDAVLVTLHDVTELQKAQENKANLMQQLSRAMMRAIDLHDPYSANHSAKTADIASAIGQALNLNENDQSALETAANLCNLGKLFISKDILTKSEKLTEEEEKTVQNETIFARDILEDIDFEGPVMETISQKHESLDGSGYPKGISGDAILLTSRILAVANAFVAMISPRAYRTGLTVENALSQLLTDADIKYDRKVVAALFHVAENEIDWSSWHLDR